MKLVPSLVVPYLDNGVVQRQIFSEMSGRDQVNPASLIELERRCLLVAAADEESPLEDFVRDSYCVWAQIDDARTDSRSNLLVCR